MSYTTSRDTIQYARWLEKNNQLKQLEMVDAEIEKLYRVAAENGHIKANINLQNGGIRKKYLLKDHEYLRFSQQLIDAGIASGYLFVGYFLQKGIAGLKLNAEAALGYYRKAADMGSAEAQYYVGTKLEHWKGSPDTAAQMYRCAAEQAHGEAAVTLGFYFKLRGHYAEAIELFQLGVAGGSDAAAGFLEEAFKDVLPEDKLYYLAQNSDQERSERYQRIGKMLEGYSYANPKVPEINDIVPLPPAPLPEWDGKLQWVEARKANIAPEKPGEALINELAKEKGLNPATGKPLPGSPVFHTANFPVLTCYSEQPCPKAGYWMMTKYFSPSGGNARYTQYFEEGQIMPLAMVTYTRPRLWPLRDKVTTFPSGVFWGMFD